LKDGEPIGHETVGFERSAQRTMVDVSTETKVKVLFLDFHYTHHRQEIWQSGTLTSMVADTDDDGSVHHIEAQRSGDQVHLTVDGASRDVAGDVLPLTLWDKGIVEHPNLYSIVDGQPYHVTVTALGETPVTMGGKSFSAQHYHMAGDVERELWFGADGLLLKAAFQRRGYPIEIIRE
jgi:hypothetical protein